MTSPRREFFRRQQKTRANLDTSDWAEKAQAVIDACHPEQRAYATDPGKRIAALVGRGGGKTTGARARLARKLLTIPRARLLFIAATHKSAKKLMWIPMKELLAKLGIEAKFNETDLEITIPKTGASLQLASADNAKAIEKYRGLPFHEVVIDECASHNAKLFEHLVQRVITPRLGDYDGVLVLIGTPGHVLRGLFYDITRLGSDIGRDWKDRDNEDHFGKKKWSVHRWTVKDGAPHVPALANVWRNALEEKELNGWTDDNPVWKREYLGLWAADDTENVFKYRIHNEETGEPWNQWDPQKTPDGFAILDKPQEYHFVYGNDMGHSDPFACNVFAFHPHRKELLHVFGYERKGMYAKTIAQFFLGEELSVDKPSGVFRHTGWPDGIVADTAGLGGAILDDLANVYGIPIKPADKKHKHDFIELFNGDLVDGRIKILKGSLLEEQLLTIQWSMDDYGTLKEDRNFANHSTDSAIYARAECYHLFGEEPGPPPPTPGSPEAVDAWEAENEERLARKPNEFGIDPHETYDNLLGL